MSKAKNHWKRLVTNAVMMETEEDVRAASAVDLPASDRDQSAEIDAFEGTADELPDLNETGFWQMLRRFFFMSKTERLQERRWRLQQLNQSIEDDPDAAVNYLLRGELHLQAGRTDIACDDFRRAAKLAEAQFKTERFGLAAQAVHDKALRHLEQYDTES